MDSPLVSVIVPVYNVEKYLRKCLESIVIQTYHNLEIFLIDDGSTDSSGKICDEYSARDKRITVIHKKNEGVSVARNVGLNHAQGVWISFVDSDDWINLNMYEVLIEESQNCDVIFFPFKEYYNDNTTRIFSAQAFKSNNRNQIEKFILLLKDNCIHYEFFGYTCNKLFKNELIKQNNLKFQTCLSFREDEVFTSNYCKYINSLKFLPIAFYNYRRHVSGLTVRKKKSEDYYLLGMYIKESSICYSNTDLVNFDLYRGYICLLKSINLSESWRKAFYYLKESLYYKHNYNIPHICRRDALIFKYNFTWSVLLFLIASIYFNRRRVFSFANIMI